MLEIDDKRVCRACAAYSGGNGYCANLPGHPFEGVTVEEYAALHPDDEAAAAYLRARNEETQSVQGAPGAPRSAAAWKRALGEPGLLRRVPRPDADEGMNQELVEYGGGPSFDEVYTTPLLDWVFESRNVGRHDGHMAALRVTRNETGLPWADGWTKGDEALEDLMSAAMAQLDSELDKRDSVQDGLVDGQQQQHGTPILSPLDPVNDPVNESPGESAASLAASEAVMPETRKARSAGGEEGHEPSHAPGIEALGIAPERFGLGQLVATPGALEALEAANTSPAELLGRHRRGNWGDVDKDDWQANERALGEGTRLLSAYTLSTTNETVWIITEWDRSATTILRPDGAP